MLSFWKDFFKLLDVPVITNASNIQILNRNFKLF